MVDKLIDAHIEYESVQTIHSQFCATITCPGLVAPAECPVTPVLPFSPASSNGKISATLSATQKLLEKIAAVNAEITVECLLLDHVINPLEKRIVDYP